LPGSALPKHAAHIYVETSKKYLARRVGRPANEEAAAGGFRRSAFPENENPIRRALGARGLGEGFGLRTGGGGSPWAN
jgi:hypothetical protein